MIYASAVETVGDTLLGELSRLARGLHAGVRGFNPHSVDNVRIDGLYFDQRGRFRIVLLRLSTPAENNR
jgi:hypothetical protein